MCLHSIQTSTRRQRENSGIAEAQAWDNWGSTLQKWLGPATELMLEMAAVNTGGRVLDVAAGAGDQTRNAAKRVAPHPIVLATDIYPKILDFAQKSAVERGCENVRIRLLDAKILVLNRAALTQ